MWGAGWGRACECDNWRGGGARYPRVHGQQWGCRVEAIVRVGGDEHAFFSPRFEDPGSTISHHFSAVGRRGEGYSGVKNYGLMD